MVWCTSPVLATISVTVAVLWQVLARSGQCWQVWQVPKPWLLGDEAMLASSDSRDLASSGTFWQVLAGSGQNPYYRAVRISVTYSRLGSQPQNRK
jgi:hypothetical protein